MSALAKHSAPDASQNHLYVPLSLWQIMQHHARQDLPCECVGLLFGYQRGYAWHATHSTPLRNCASYPRTTYHTDPSELLRTLQNADARGDDLVAIYHSHPHSDAYPSETDLAQAYYAVPALIIDGRSLAAQVYMLTPPTTITPIRHTMTHQTKTGITLQHAHPSHTPMLSEIAEAAKRYWGYPEHWLQAWQNDLTITPEQLHRWQVVTATDGAEVYGFYALAKQTEDTAEIEHLWVRPEQLGTGLGRLLVEHALHTARAQGCAKMLAVADPYACSFYEHLGFKVFGDIAADVDNTPRRLPTLHYVF